MSNARIVVDPHTIRRGRNGPATGVVWLSIGEGGFPAVGWDDFVVVVLGWWAKAALQLLRGISKREQVRFMDGPYLAQVSIQSSSEWAIELFDTRRRHPKATALVSPRILVDSIVDASEAVLSACRVTECWSTDADTLRQLDLSLRTEALALGESED